MSEDKAKRNAQMEGFAMLLEDLVREIKPSAEFSWKKMFGGAGYYVDEGMFAGMYTDGALSLKLSEADQQDLLKLEGTSEGFGKNTINLPQSMLDDKATLKEWLSKSMDYAASRPPKKKKKA